MTRSPEVQQLVQMGFTGGAPAPPEFLALMFTPAWMQANLPVLQALAPPPDDPSSARVRYLHLQASQQHDAWDQLPMIDAPTLVLHGGDDEVAPAENARLLARRIPRAELRLLDRGRHGFLLENAAETAEIVLDFLARHPLPTSSPPPTSEAADSGRSQARQE